MPLLNTEKCSHHLIHKMMTASSSKTVSQSNLSQYCIEKWHLVQHIRIFRAKCESKHRNICDKLVHTHACELLGEAGNNPVTGCWWAIINLCTIRWYWSNRTPELLRLLILFTFHADRVYSGRFQKEIYFRFDSCKITHIEYVERLVATLQITWLITFFSRLVLDVKCSTVSELIVMKRNHINLICSSFYHVNNNSLHTWKTSLIFLIWTNQALNRRNSSTVERWWGEWKMDEKWYHTMDFDALLQLFHS